MTQLHALKTKILIYSWQTLQGVMNDGTFSFGFRDNHGAHQFRCHSLVVRLQTLPGFLVRG
jgi:hypothetical protein